MFEKLRKRKWIPIIENREEKVYLKLSDKFLEQFPAVLEPYLMIDLNGEKKYQLTDEVRDLHDFGFQTVMDVALAKRIQKELDELPLVMVDYKGEDIG